MLFYFILRFALESALQTGTLLLREGPDALPKHVARCLCFKLGREGRCHQEGG